MSAVIKAFPKFNDAGSAGNGALESITRQMTASSQNAEGFRTAHLSGDREGALKELHDTYLALLKQAHDPEINENIKLLAAKNCDLYPDANFVFGKKFEDRVGIEQMRLMEGYNILNYPNLHKWDDIESQNGYDTLPNYMKNELKAGFHLWDKDIQKCMKDLKILFSSAETLGYTDEEIIRIDHNTGYRVNSLRGIRAIMAAEDDNEAVILQLAKRPETISPKS